MLLRYVPTAQCEFDSKQWLALAEKELARATGIWQEIQRRFEARPGMEEVGD